MVKKKMGYEEDDTLMSELAELQKDYTDTIEKGYKGWDSSGNGIPAKSPLAAGGRQCLRCSNQLFIKEVTDNDIIVVFCRNCGLEMHHTDLEFSESTNHMYQHIPDDLVIRYMEAREDEKRRNS